MKINIPKSEKTIKREERGARIISTREKTNTKLTMKDLLQHIDDRLDELEEKLLNKP